MAAYGRRMSCCEGGGSVEPRNGSQHFVDASGRSRDLTLQVEQNAKLGWWPQRLYYII